MHSELKKWLLLLLLLIDVTAERADTHLKLFLKGKGVVRTFKKDIERAVSCISVNQGSVKEGEEQVHVYTYMYL